MLTLHYNTNIPNMGFGYVQEWSKQRVFLALLCYTQSGNDLKEDLARFGYKLNMKVIKKRILWIIWAAYLKHAQKSGGFA